MTNIQKVAELANVSVATVSRVINNAGNVTPQTKKQVEDAIAQLNYVPNMLARNFRTSKSKSILVILTNISNLFYMEIVHGISEYANEQGYDILLSETNGELNKQIDCLNKVKNRIADGAVFLESTIHDNALLSLEKSYPVVQCCTYSEEAALPYVIIDNKKIGFLAAKALIEAGHKKLAFVGTNDKSLYNRERRAGFLKAAEDEGISEDNVVVLNAELSFEGGRNAASRLVKEKVNAVFFVSDMQAIGALRTFEELGIRTPQDIALIGCDNLEICNMVNPPLTSVGQPAREMGRESARLLIERIEDKDIIGCRNVIFQPELVLRQTV
jgi:LacI family transcriptional regulator, repressor for deo operon, udp, cdd, tsx, nupC, and nupG